MTEVLDILNSLPRFEEYAYSNEPIRNVVRDRNGNISTLEFPVGSLQRVKTNTPLGVQHSWVLNNSCYVMAVFVPDSFECELLDREGNCTLERKGDLYVFTNTKTGATTTLSADKQITPLKRLMAHWEGFLSNSN